MKGKNGTTNWKAVVAVVALAVIAAGMFLAWRVLSPKGEAGSKTVVVEVVHGDGSTRDFNLKTDAAYLGEALVEGEVVEDNQGAYGLYILTADGETADESNQEWWQVTRGGEKLNTGADSTPIADGEHYELTLTVGYDG